MSSNPSSLLEANVKSAVEKTIEQAVETHTATLRSANESLGRELDMMRAQSTAAKERLSPLQPLLDAGITAEAIYRASLAVAVLKNPNDVNRLYQYLVKTGWKETMEHDWIDPQTKAKMIFHGAYPAQLKRDTAIFEKL